MKCHMDHIVLNAENVDTMVDFYANLLGMQAERIEEYQKGKVPFPSVRLNEDTIIDLFPQKLWQTDSGKQKGFGNLNHFCIAVDEQTWQALSERLQSKNIPIEDGPAPRWGARGTGTSIYFRDPEDNLIEARYYQNKKDSTPCLYGS